MRTGTVLRLAPFFPRYLYRLYRGKPIALSFDITDMCNLKCPYCYWWEGRRGKELSLEKVVELAKCYRKSGILYAAWIGGEPLLRPDVLEAVTPIFPVNWIVTNGTDPNADHKESFDPFKLPNTSIVVSLDGVGAVHNRSRAREGLYELIKKRYWNKPIMTTTTLHQGNKDQPEKLLKNPGGISKLKSPVPSDRR